jgi:L-rhamnose isomerase
MLRVQELCAEALLVSRQHVEEYREQYDKLCAEDKVMDRGFKREFHDIPAHYVDQLYKLFRRRPR